MEIEKMTSNYDEIRPTLKTGDIILFSSHTPVGGIIKLFSKSHWTHCGHVICFTEPFNFVALWEADVITGYVYLTNLGARIKKYRGDVVVRHLEGIEFSGEDMKTLRDIREDFKYREYEHVPFWQLLRAAFDDGTGFGKDQPEDLSEFFCSELTAETLQRLGLLDDKLSSNEYVPGDFSEENTNLKLIKGYYGPEIPIKTRTKKLGIF